MRFLLGEPQWLCQGSEQSHCGPGCALNCSSARISGSAPSWLVLLPGYAYAGSSLSPGSWLRLKDAAGNRRCAYTRRICVGSFTLREMHLPNEFARRASVRLTHWTIRPFHYLAGFLVRGSGTLGGAQFRRLPTPAPTTANCPSAPTFRRTRFSGQAAVARVPPDPGARSSRHRCRSAFATGTSPRSDLPMRAIHPPAPRGCSSNSRRARRNRPRIRTRLRGSRA